LKIYIPRFVLVFLLVLSGFGAGVLFIQGTATTPDDSYKSFISSNYKVFSMPVPDDLTFCGEKVPTHFYDVNEKLDRELLVNAYRHSATFLNIKRSNRWFPVIEPILAKNGIPDDFKYLCVIESDLSNAVSPSGARGFWQFLDVTAKEYGLEVTEEVDERYDVVKSTEAACKYLNEAYKKFGSWALVAASYNMGMSGVSGELAKQSAKTYWDLQLNEETGRYVFRILAMRQIMQDPEGHGFHLRSEDKYPQYETVKVAVSSTIPDLYAFATQQGVNYKTIKILNPWMRKTKLEVKPGKSYDVSLPADKSLWVAE